MEIEIDYKTIASIETRLLKTNKDLVNQDILLSLAQQLKDSIILRTFSGVDYRGNKFKKYKKDYADSKGVTPEDVNLYSTNTGNHMINDIAKRVISNDTSELYFRSADKQELARKHMEGIGTPKREFFGIGDMDITELSKSYNVHVDEVLRRNNFA
jgi:hypothetical protein